MFKREKSIKAERRLVLAKAGRAGRRWEAVADGTVTFPLSGNSSDLERVAVIVT